MKHYLVFAMFFAMSSASTFSARAADGIYGYAIQCQNADKSVKVSARQWDDDFAFQSVGLGKAAKFVFVDSEQNTLLSPKTLKFESYEEDGVDLKLTIKKTTPNSKDGAKGKAVLQLGSKKVTLSCIIKYAEYEDEFDNNGLAEWADSILVTPEVWGGKNIQLTVNGQDASIRLDCAVGNSILKRDINLPNNIR